MPLANCGQENGSANASGSMICRLLKESRLLVDLEGAKGVGVAIAPDLGVLWEDWVAVVVISSWIFVDENGRLN